MQLLHGRVVAAERVVDWAEAVDGSWPGKRARTEVIGPGLYPSMAIDASDRVHVCYSTINKELIYATRVSLDQWNSERVDESVHGTHPSLAVASNGRVCVSYYDPDHGELKFASKGRGETRWHITTVDTGVKETGFYSASSIAVGCA